MVKTETDIWLLLAAIPDPEIPVLSILDLGIVRRVIKNDDEHVTVHVTPTYSGCPAVKAIEKSISEKLTAAGLIVSIVTDLSPAWTTDWITAQGREKLLAYGIAPPVDEVDKSVLFAEAPRVPCPRCKSANTRMVSQFGSTACKAHYQCNECLEPFDYFKCLK
jgi:ring-1,2-phenylacetyl-CoA epoxidase subunit PaaD